MNKLIQADIDTIKENFEACWNDADINGRRLFAQFHAQRLNVSMNEVLKVIRAIENSKPLDVI